MIIVKFTLLFLEIQFETHISSLKQACHPEIAEGAMTPPDFDRQVNPIVQEGQIMPTTLLLAPSDFQTILRPCKDLHFYQLGAFEQG